MNAPVKTSCPYCGVGCGVLATPDGRGGATIAGDPDHPANFGKLCVKGSALGETLGIGARLLTPLADRVPATWNRALEKIARGFKSAIDAHGPQSVAMYLSGQLLTEDYYVANKLMKGFVGSANCDTNSRLCMASSVAGHRRAFGSDTVPGCYEDLDSADLIVLVGSNTAWCHPVLYQRMQAAREKRGTRIVNIDPRRTATSEGVDLQLSIAPGMDSVLFAWALVQLAAQDKFDRQFIAAHTSGLEPALARARQLAPNLDTVGLATGLGAADVTQFTDWFCAMPRTVTCYSQGVNQSAQGTDKVNAILNCHLATGRIGKDGCGPLSLTGQPNAMGGREVGGLSNQLAAHMGFSPPEVDRVRRFWNAPRMAQAEGLKAVDLFDAVASGKIKALWIMHTNPAVSLPRADVVRGSLAKLDFLAVSEARRDVDGLLDHAHVALPASVWGEKDGTVTNSERRITRQRAFLPQAGEAKPDWWAVTQVARRMGYEKAFPYQSAAEIFKEHAALSAFENDGSRDFDIGGLAAMDSPAYDALQPAQWPMPAMALHGQARFFANGDFFTPDRKARFIAVAPPALRETPDRKFPLILNTGRVRDQWHTMSRTGLSPRLGSHIREPFVEVHPEDAKSLMLADGDYAVVRTRHAAATLRVDISPGQQRGMLFAPIHWNDMNAGAARVGALISAHADPVSGQPESKATPASATRAGMKSFGFLLARKSLALPRWLVHARFAIAGGEAILFACQCGRAELANLLSNYLPDEGGRGAMSDEALGTYRRLTMERQRIASLLFIGPARDEAALEWAMSQFDAPSLDAAARRALLAGRSGSGIDLGPVICACNGVRKSAIRAVIAAGAKTVEAVGEACKAGTACGSCKPELKAILAGRQAIPKAPFTRP